jgi:hypothetical protein
VYSSPLSHDNRSFNPFIPSYSTGITITLIRWLRVRRPFVPGTPPSPLYLPSSSSPPLYSLPSLPFHLYHSCISPIFILLSPPSFYFLPLFFSPSSSSIIHVSTSPHFIPPSLTSLPLLFMFSPLCNPFSPLVSPSSPLLLYSHFIFPQYLTFSLILHFLLRLSFLSLSLSLIHASFFLPSSL